MFIITYNLVEDLLYKRSLIQINNPKKANPWPKSKVILTLIFCMVLLNTLPSKSKHAQ